MTKPPIPTKDPYYVYIVRCADGTLYCGIATDVERRVVEHNSSEKGAKYTRGRRPVRLVYSVAFPDRSGASKEEARIKTLPRIEKEKLIRAYLPKSPKE